MPMLQLRAKGIDAARQALRGWNPVAFAERMGPQAGSILVGWLRQYIARRTGATANTLGAVQAGSHVLASGDLVAFYLYSGTRAHLIRAKSALALAFPGTGGDTVFRREVHHPGTAGTNYPLAAWGSAAPEITFLARRTAAELLRGAP